MSVSRLASFFLFSMIYIYTYIYIYIYMCVCVCVCVCVYCHPQTDDFVVKKTLQCGLTRRKFQAGMETRPTLR